ncbi:hypothetical protein F5Y18DRAFT_174533 [Xylariaceae sp. FL1019]|nr:hypothetical protein F5Y18DRAFT_174533 [Xylariaceae sp. FL1019]
MSPTTWPSGANVVRRAIFRLPHFVGNDICHIPRIKRMLDDYSYGRRFIKRILNKEEIRNPRTANILGHWLVEPMPHPAPAPSASLTEHGYNRAVEFMAGRYAAKEAVIKAHPLHALSFTSITLSPFMKDWGDMEDMEEGKAQPKDLWRNASSKQPLVARLDRARLKPASVSISHDGEYATAFCVASSERPPSYSHIEEGHIEEGSSRSLDPTARAEAIRASILSLATGLEKHKEVERKGAEKAQQIERLLQELQSVSQAIDSDGSLESDQEVADDSDISRLTDKIRLLTSQLEQQTHQQE